MKTTTYYAPLEYSSSDFPHRHNQCTVARYHKLEVSPQTKVVAAIACTVFAAVLLTVLSSINLILGLVMLPVLIAGAGAAYTGLFAHYRREAPAPLGTRLDDEVKDIVDTYRRMIRVRDMSPEGSGYHQRIDEYGKLAFDLFSEVERLPRMTGHDQSFHRVLNEIQTRMKALVDAGDNLVDLIGTRRAENTLASIQHIGVDEYADAVSLETMAFRALNAGDDEPTPKEPTPKKIQVGGLDVDVEIEMMMRDLGRMKYGRKKGTG